MHWTILVCAIILAGVSFIGGRLTAPDQPVVLDLEAALVAGPPEGPGDRLDPDYRDLVISTLQHALDSAAREGAATQLRPRVTPCRVEASDCAPLAGVD